MQRTERVKSSPKALVQLSKASTRIFSWTWRRVVMKMKLVVLQETLRRAIVNHYEVFILIMKTKIQKGVKLPKSSQQWSVPNDFSRRNF